MQESGGGKEDPYYFICSPSIQVQDNMRYLLCLLGAGCFLIFCSEPHSNIYLFECRCVAVLRSTINSEALLLSFKF